MIARVNEVTAMAYMLLVHEPVEQRAERGEVAGRAAYDRMLEFTAELQQRGVLMASSSLADLAHGTRVQGRGAAARVLDGPFAEAKEMVGGFFLLNVATRDEAVALAKICPAAEWCTVEVRETGPCYVR
jgi:hypothetical protein